jgi:hypothetical protein
MRLILSCLAFLAVGLAHAEEARAPLPLQLAAGKAPPASGATLGRWQHMLLQMDTNGDGQITKDEFMAYAAARFAGYDTEGSGVLTEEKVIRLERKEMKDFNAAHEHFHVHPPQTKIPKAAPPK